MSVIPTVEDTSTDYGPKVSQRFIPSSYLFIMVQSISFLSILFYHYPIKGQPAVETEPVFGGNSSEADGEICDKDHQLCGYQGARDDEETKSPQCFAFKVLVEEEEEVFTEEEVEEIKPRRVRSQRKVLINHRINVLLISYSEHFCIPT